MVNLEDISAIVERDGTVKARLAVTVWLMSSILFVLGAVVTCVKAAFIIISAIAYHVDVSDVASVVGRLGGDVWIHAGAYGAAAYVFGRLFFFIVVGEDIKMTRMLKIFTYILACSYMAVVGAIIASQVA